MTAVEDKARPSAIGEVEPGSVARGVRRRRLVWVAAGGLLLAIGAARWLWASTRFDETVPATARPVATATVERATLSATQSWVGTLAYGAPLTVNSGAMGTVTRLPGQGAIVRRGAQLYRVDERPVTLLVGAVPMYRDLAIGDSGVDVRQLEKNLAKLGYDGFAPDTAFTAATADVVRAWQRRMGVEPTGRVARSDVVFAPTGGRVDALHVHTGSVVSPGTPILDLTGTDEIAAVDAELDDRDRLGIGSKATVVLPDGEQVRSRVRAVRVVRTAAGESGPGASGEVEPESVLHVEIALEKGPSDLVGTRVKVSVAIDERADVLVVPVTALLALAEGGYGLEVVRDDGTTVIVRVDTGLFADGKVEVSGAGIAEGSVVGVAGR